jgi:hypothetical protein
MKKYLFGFAAVIALGFSACTDDEPVNDGPAVSPIVAKWEVTDITVRGQDSITDGMVFDSSLNRTYNPNELTLDLRVNGDIISTSTNGNVIEKDTTQYTYNAPVLKINGALKVMDLDIDKSEFYVTFNGDNIMLKGKEIYQSIDLGVGFPITAKITTDINAKKK